MAGQILTFAKWRLATTEILYHLPDYPGLLQSFVGQEYDLAPNYPQLEKVLDFWTRSLDGPVHSVSVSQARRDHYDR
jgi:uncharacterized protein Usg